MNKRKKEVWKPAPIEPYDQYFLISNKGRLKSIERYVDFSNQGGKVKRLKQERIKKPQVYSTNSIPYHTLNVMHKDVHYRKAVPVHLLVGMAFVEKKNEGDDYLLFKKGRLINSNNLEWVSALEFKKRILEEHFENY